MSWVADTSWLYALMDTADTHHDEARAQAEEPAPVEIPEPILAETLDLIAHRHGKALAELTLKGFERLPHFVLGEPSPHAESVSVWRDNRGLSFADATAVAHARTRNYGLRTFDRRQQRAFQAAKPG